MHARLNRLRCRSVFAATLILFVGLLLASCGPPAGDSAGIAGFSTGGGPDSLLPDSLLPAEPFPGEPGDLWMSPSGRGIVPGTVDELGYVLPLDVYRPSLPSTPAAAPERRQALWWSELAGVPAAGAGGVLKAIEIERRIGPDDGHTQNETSIDIAGDTLVAGWNQFTDSGLVMGVGRSLDGAQSWSWELFDGHDVMSDPAVKAGGGGLWYYAYLAAGGTGGADAEIYVRRSLDDGASWQPPVAVTADNDFDDKPYIDARGNEVLVAWADFGFSPARVRAARSLDGGLTFGNDTVLVNASGGGNGACPVIAADGTYYVFWRGSAQEFLWLSRSLDQGASWSADMPIAAMSPLPSTLPGGFRIVNLPSAAANPVTGDLAVVWNDQLFGNPDILSIRSTDGGDTWSPAIRVNDDIGTDAQFFPWVATDQTGMMHTVWYDRRLNGFDIDVYYAASIDSGASYQPSVRVTARSYTPVLPWESGAAPFIGDYNAVAAAAGQAYPFYQDARTGTQDVYVTVVPTVGGLFADGFESGDVSRWSVSAGGRATDSDEIELFGA